jgi:hypothetical protein
MNCQEDAKTPKSGSVNTASYGTQRERFERLITTLTGCAVGDGTLTVTQDGREYVNAYVDYMWKRFQQTAKGAK